MLYSVWPSPSSDVSISLGTGDLELHFANKRATSLPGDGETEYTMHATIHLITYYTLPEVHILCVGIAKADTCLS